VTKQTFQSCEKKVLTFKELFCTSDSGSMRPFRKKCSAVS